MQVTHCPGCRGEHLYHTPSNRPGFASRFEKALMQFRSVTCLDCGLISNYALDKSIAVLRGREGLKPQASEVRDEI